MRKATGRKLAKDNLELFRFFASGSKRGRKPGYRKPKVLKKDLRTSVFLLVS